MVRMAEEDLQNQALGLSVEYMDFDQYNAVPDRSEDMGSSACADISGECDVQWILRGRPYVEVDPAVWRRRVQDRVEHFDANRESVEGSSPAKAIKESADALLGPQRALQLSQRGEKVVGISLSGDELWDFTFADLANRTAGALKKKIETVDSVVAASLEVKLLDADEPLVSTDIVNNFDFVVVRATMAKQFPGPLVCVTQSDADDREQLRQQLEAAPSTFGPVFAVSITVPEGNSGTGDTFSFMVDEKGWVLRDSHRKFDADGEQWGMCVVQGQELAAGVAFICEQLLPNMGCQPRFELAFVCTWEAHVRCVIQVVIYV